MNSLPWLSLKDAFRTVRDERQLTDLEAITMLIDACSSKVRSRKLPWPDDEDEVPPKYWRPISALVWRGAAIDPEYGWLFAADDRIVRGEIEVNAAHLELWLATHGGGETKIEQVPQSLVGANKPGRPPVLLEKLKEKMRNEIKEGVITLPELRTMKQVALASRYGRVNRETACKARDAVLSENTDK